MGRTWTFGQKLGAGFAAVVALTLVIAVVAVYALRTVVASKDRVISVDAQALIAAQRLHSASERRVAAGRAFLITREDRFVDELHVARADFADTLSRLRDLVGDGEARPLIDDIERADADYERALERAITLRRGDAQLDAVAHAFESDVVPLRDDLARKVDAFISAQTERLETARRASSEAASAAVDLEAGIAAAATLLAALVGALLSRTIARQIGSAVHHVQSSSAELQAAATQQATGAKEQATAMAEITTTISELLATSRQIAESAQRVAQIAQETSSGARSGDQTLQRAHEAMTGTQRQVDVIVTHMLDLGRKSQQIGGVLEVINELAEQTNILAINATIEAAGAGDAGKRFAVVADEIRKLADRVGGSTKEIRGLIEEVRAAVNTTVMATEGGSKAVDAIMRQFADVAASFQQIGGLVSTTTEAAREIELSTKQQATAVEQVNLAISNVAQATRETEASSGQTLQTASQLATLSRDLAKLVQPSTAT